MNTLTPEEYFRRLLKRRVERFKALVDREAPDALVAFEAGNVIDAIAGLLGDRLYAEMSRRHIARIRHSAGYCQACNSAVPAARPRFNLCDRCMEGAEADSRGTGSGKGAI